MITRCLRHAVALLLIGLSSAAGAAAEAVAEAQMLLQEGKYQRALSVLDSYLRSAPQDAEARFTRGLALVRLNRADDAIRAFSDLTRDYPQLPEPYNNLAVLYAQRGEYDKARDALEAALASHPSYGTAHENLGDIYAALAAAAYGRAVTLDPENKGAQTKLKLLNQLDSLADSGAAVMPAGLKTEEPPAAGVPGPDPKVVHQLLKDWAAAWSAQDVDKYLGFYSEEFAPEGGASREAWEAQRRRRVADPKQIKVEVGQPDIKVLAEDRIRVMFQQDYQSDQFSDIATKVLELRNTGGNWRIVREYSR